MIKEIILNDFDKKYILKKGDKIVSYVETHRLYEILDITDVFTAKDERRKGNATEILKYIIKNTDADKIMLEVNEENLEAINLYKKMGFEIISKRKNYYKDKTALIMEVKK